MSNPAVKMTQAVLADASLPVVSAEWLDDSKQVRVYLDRAEIKNLAWQTFDVSFVSSVRQWQAENLTGQVLQALSFRDLAEEIVGLTQ